MTDRSNEFVLTVAIPCYNSQGYMGKAIRSALSGGPSVEVLIVDDGSTDDTAVIGRKFEADYPDRVRYIYKENGGHGDAVMTGLREARGVYFKVLDSDDWFSEDSLAEVVDHLERWIRYSACYDMMICNYVYDRQGSRRKVSIGYAPSLPVREPFAWDHVGKFRPGRYILMHSVIYRRQLLLDCGLELPKHTFYVDNIYVYYPLPHVKSMYYLDTDLYHYYIGREGQSVNEKIMIRRIDQQLFVTNSMRDMYDLNKLENENLRRYMAEYLAIMYIVPSVLLNKSGTEEHLEKKDKLWADLKEYDPAMYKLIHRQTLARLSSINNPAWNHLLKYGYSISRLLFHFN